MKNIKNIPVIYSFLVGVVLFVLTLVSCDSFVDVDVSPDKLTTDETFSSDASATSAVLALYSYTNTTYGLLYFPLFGGLYADELQYTSTSTDIHEFAQSSVTTTNSTLNSNLWTYPYAVIRETNQAIAGITNSKNISDSVKSRLIGESKFFRAQCYFNLVNSFGDVPLCVSSSELDNAYLPRASAADVWTQIISDLKDAESSLPAKYNTTLRVRANKYAASALLARAYLYTKDYTNAEVEATKVIEATEVQYTLPALNSAFVNTSTEVILQLATYYGYSFFGSAFRTSSATTVSTYALYPGFVNSFESGDSRRKSWVDSVTYSGTKYYKINKYKLVSATAGNEYNVLLRFAEVYLIRAEARAQLGANLNGAQSDLNKIRTRSGLANTTASTQADLLTAIAKERKVELFGENHRWFDLKRTNTVDAVIGALKTTWKSTSALYPIPNSQILVNASLTQNQGYN